VARRNVLPHAARVGADRGRSPAECISNETPAARYWSNSSSVCLLRASSARTPASNRSALQLRRKLQSQRRKVGSRLGRSTNASPPVTSWRIPSRTIPGAGRGKVRLGQTQPVLPCDVPPPTAPRSSTTTSAPARRSYHAHARPTTPTPTTTTRISLTAAPSSVRGPGRRQSFQFANFFSFSWTLSPRIGCSARSGEYRLAGTVRPRLSAIART
jgi:hypothetical protein